MPKFLEKDLKAEAAKKGLTGKRADRYVYGAMNNIGAMKGSAETVKGREMERKHERDHGQKPAHKPAHKPIHNLGAYAHPKKRRGR